MLCNEHISTVIPGDYIILPVSIPARQGLDGIDQGTLVVVLKSFESPDSPSQWILHVSPVGSDVVRSVWINVNALVLVDG